MTIQKYVALTTVLLACGTILPGCGQRQTPQQPSNPTSQIFAPVEAPQTAQAVVEPTKEAAVVEETPAVAQQETPEVTPTVVPSEPAAETVSTTEAPTPST